MRHAGVTYRMMGYAAGASAWRAHRASVASTISSFASLTDAAILAVEPWTIEIRTLPGASSLTTYAASNPSPVDVSELASLNRVTPQDVLSGGDRIKWVVGRPLP
jgi:predicted Zn-dependent protease